MQHPKREGFYFLSCKIKKKKKKFHIFLDGPSLLTKLTVGLSKPGLIDASERSRFSLSAPHRITNKIESSSSRLWLVFSYF